MNGSTSSQSALAERQAAAKTSSLRSIPAATETLPHFHGTGYENNCLQDDRLHAKLHWKMRNRLEVAVHLVRKAGSALSKSIGLENFQTAYFFYIIYDSRTALPHVLVSRRDIFSPRSQRECLSGVQRPVNRQEEVNKAVWKRSGVLDRAMRLLTLQLFSNLHALLGRNSLYTLDEDKLVE